MGDKKLVVSGFLRKRCRDLLEGYNRQLTLRVYGIPRGGLYALMLLMDVAKSTGHNVVQVYDPGTADIILDDIIDSGKTAADHAQRYGIEVKALLNKRTSEYDRKLGWIVFPWEAAVDDYDTDSSVSDNITRLIQYMGDDPARPGLTETPERVRKALNFWSSGYTKNPSDIMKTFEDGAEDCDEMISVSGIPVYSMCEHHMASIFGTATVAYIPDGKVIGLSKMSRLVDIFARRLQVQERLTNQVANAMMEHLKPLGVGVIIKARHMCMESRGLCQTGTITTTSALRGVMKTKAEARAEFMALAHSGTVL